MNFTILVNLKVFECYFFDHLSVSLAFWYFHIVLANELYKNTKIFIYIYKISFLRLLNYIITSNHRYKIMIEVASLRYDVIFKKVFSEPHIFTAFVKDLIGIDIEIDQVETEKSFSPIIGKVDSRFDLFAEDKKNRIIIDIQHKRYGDHYDRFLHYHCTALLEQITSFANYKPKMQVFTIDIKVKTYYDIISWLIYIKTLLEKLQGIIASYSKIK
jgi:hypothetical protein